MNRSDGYFFFSRQQFDSLSNWYLWAGNASHLRSRKEKGERQLAIRTTHQKQHTAKHTHNTQLKNVPHRLFLSHEEGECWMTLIDYEESQLPSPESLLLSAIRRERRDSKLYLRCIMGVLINDLPAEALAGFIMRWRVARKYLYRQTWGESTKWCRFPILTANVMEHILPGYFLLLNTTPMGCTSLYSLQYTLN